MLLAQLDLHGPWLPLPPHQHDSHRNRQRIQTRCEGDLCGAGRVYWTGLGQCFYWGVEVFKGDEGRCLGDVRGGVRVKF